MQELKLKEELVRVVHHEVRQHMMRTTGSDVRCYVTHDLSAIVGQVDVPDGVIKFTIPVVAIFERSQYPNAGANVAMSPAAEARRLG